MTTITVEREDDRFVITDEETGVTTQGETKVESLLMLVDALAGCEDVADDPLAVALDVFVPDPETEEFIAKLRGAEYEPPEVAAEQVLRQREVVLRLARSHRKIDYSDEENLETLRSLLQSGASV